MPSLLYTLKKKGIAHPPEFLSENVCYETMMGSVAYGVSTDSSDVDIYGFGIPPKDSLFPHLRGEIPGFGTQIKRFEQYQEHHLADDSAKKSYDFAVFSIVKYFQLCMENNPNMIDSLFTPQFCVLHITRVGNIVRENKKEFLHKGSFHKFKGYAYSQLHKMRTKTPDPGSKREAGIKEHGYDLKFAYHVIRLLDEAEQILVHHDIDLQRNREQLKAIRRGEITEDEVIRLASEKESHLESLYISSKLRHSPNEKLLKTLLLNCLEEHYGSLDQCIVEPDFAIMLLKEIKEKLNSYPKI